MPIQLLYEPIPKYKIIYINNIGTKERKKKNIRKKIEKLGK